MRYFADGPVTLKAIGTGLAGMDPQFKIDAGELMYGKERTVVTALALVPKTFSVSGRAPRCRFNDSIVS